MKMVNIALPDAEIKYCPNVINTAQSYVYFEELMNSLVWRQDNIIVYGKSVKIPRLQAWYGDADKRYQYSQLQLTPKVWTPLLDKLKAMAENAACVQFNSVLANYYRDGKDAVGWHSDDEPELGEQPIIASLSLGGVREFHLKHKISGDKIKLPLESGSLLLMSGKTQQYWQHCITRTKKPVFGRINLTFRQIK